MISNFRHLRTLRAVIETGSVTAAARVLRVTQPAVSKSLQQIEWEIGIPLFQRVKGRLRPTPESLALLPVINNVFKSIEEVERFRRTLSEGGAGRIEVACVATFASSVLASAISQYTAHRASAEVSVSVFATRQVVEQVANNQADMGLIDTDMIARSLKTEPLCKASVGCVMPKGHRLAGKRKIAFSDLKGERLITFFEDTPTGMKIRKELSEVGLTASIAITTNQSLVACRLVQEGAGLGILDPFTIAANFLPDLTIIKMTPEIELRPCLAFPPDRPLSIAAREFIAYQQKSFVRYISKSALVFPIARS